MLSPNRFAAVWGFFCLTANIYDCEMLKYLFKVMKAYGLALNIR